MSNSTDAPTPPALVLFDGVCNFCDRSVQFIIRHDPSGQFRFAPLQGEAGQRLLSEHGLSEDPNTIVLIENGRAYLRSSAALRIARRLSGAWPAFFYLLYGIPPPLRDLGYRLIARNRYRLFGKKDACMIPSPEVRARFLA